MDNDLKAKIDTAICIGKSLFARGKVTGSSANMSFQHEDVIYITASNTCFGCLTPDSFAMIHANGESLDDKKPSKELTLHKLLYQKDSRIKAVLHTHSFYATLWSCLEHEHHEDVMPPYTPYLKMKVGTIGVVPYAKPGSPELFALFAENLNQSDGFILKNHGPIIGGYDLLAAFYGLEELEESAKIAWFLRGHTIGKIQ